MQVLIVEDDSVAVDILGHALEEFGYEVTATPNGHEALQQLRSGRFQLMISDWEMPVLNGLELCREVRARRWSSYLYIILLTSRSGSSNVACGLDSGADDYLAKPFYPEELRSRLNAAERILSLQSRDSTIFALARLAELRDPETGSHLERIREYCRILGDELSRSEKYSSVIDGDFVQLLYLTSPLHDIGKVGVPDCVLRKPGKLTVAEFEVMKGHALIGGQALDAVAQAYPRAEFLAMARDIAFSHHERYDGRGYPLGLAGDAIPLSGRITALADVYDALTVKRIYKRAYSHEEAVAMILDERGRQFDPDVTDAFIRRQADFQAMHDILSAEPPKSGRPQHFEK